MRQTNILLDEPLSYQLGMRLQQIMENQEREPWFDSISVALAILSCVVAKPLLQISQQQKVTRHARAVTRLDIIAHCSERAAKSAVRLSCVHEFGIRYHS